MKKLKTAELALLLSLAAVCLWGACSLRTQEKLSQKMIRMHVIANSDSRGDQKLKLQVRDRVLTLTEDALRAAADSTQAAAKLQNVLPQIQAEAQQEIAARGYDYPVKAELVPAAFPTREYDGFSLPGGDYMALRLTIGEGQGHNWWCVVFPPLCTTAATDLQKTAVAVGLSEEEVALMTGADTSYILKFRSVELWERLKARLGK